jgi:two-component system LytT family response regulator
MNIYKTVIVDDEKHQQEKLIGMLSSNFPQIDIVAVCDGVDEGVERIINLKPQLIFLDVIMPPLTGFDLLERISERTFEVIFTTSFTEYALNAFRVAAVDYLLKPFDVDDLHNAINKLELKKNANSTALIDMLLENVRTVSNDNIKIALPTLLGFSIVKVDDIIYCAAENNYTTVYLADNSNVVVSRSIKECEDMLREHKFVRIHKSFLINLNAVVEYVRGVGGQVKLKNGKVLEVSRQRKDEFLSFFRKL